MDRLGRASCARYEGLPVYRCVNSMCLECETWVVLARHHRRGKTLGMDDRRVIPERMLKTGSQPQGQAANRMRDGRHPIRSMRASSVGGSSAHLRIHPSICGSVYLSVYLSPSGLSVCLYACYLPGLHTQCHLMVQASLASHRPTNSQQSVRQTARGSVLPNHPSSHSLSVTQSPIQ